MATIQINSVYFTMPVTDEDRIFYDTSLDWVRRLEQSGVKSISLMLGDDLHGKPSVELKYNGRPLLSVHIHPALPKVRVTAFRDVSSREMSLGDVFRSALLPSLREVLRGDVLHVQTLLESLSLHFTSFFPE